MFFMVAQPRVASSETNFKNKIKTVVNIIYKEYDYCLEYFVDRIK